MDIIHEVKDTVAEAISGKQHESEPDKDHRAIVQGLIHNRLVWHHDSMLKNYWFFLCQKHVLLGIPCCHKFHPYTRAERLFVWLAVVVSAFGISLLASSDSWWTDSQTKIQLMSLAMSCYLAAKSMIMKALVVCASVQDGGIVQKVAEVVHKDDAVKKSFEKAGFRVACLAWVLSLIWLIAGIYVSVTQNLSWTTFAEEFFLSQVYGWVIEWATRTAKFLMGWYCQKEPTAEEKVEDNMAKKYPVGSAYPKDRNTLWQNDRSQCKGCFSEASQTVDGTEEVDNDLPASAKV
mmetsp:Transcript_104794/g.208242  ORF Transcript_104794/g.208242 Transcript_104794/m.208242 type:complete len:291 (-) Transcript_104794:279-1151(-)